MIYNLSARVTENRLIIPGYWQMVIKAPKIARQYTPGQFVSVQCAPGLEPLLKRPLGIFKTDPQKTTITLIYRVIGAGTKKLSQARPGDLLWLIGPQGRGFKLSGKEKKIILAAGGLGMVPLLSLAEKILRSQTGAEIQFFWGAAGAGHFFAKKDFFRTGIRKIHLATDDGSTGFRGNVTRLIEKYLLKERADIILACGPPPMLHQIFNISRLAGIPAQVSLEARMACGFGVCMGCVVQTVSGYQRVCDAGPVFDVREIVWP